MNISKQNLYHHVSSMVSVRGWGSRSVQKNNNSWLVLLHLAVQLEHVFTLTAVCLSTVCDIWHVHSCQKHKASESLLLNTKQTPLFLFWAFPSPKMWLKNVYLHFCFLYPKLAQKLLDRFINNCCLNVLKNCILGQNYYTRNYL